MSGMKIKNYKLKIFLTLLSKFGYPNYNLDMLSQSLSYNLSEFLNDYYNEFGLDKTEEFITKAFKKLFGEDLTHRFDLEGGDFFTIKITKYEYEPYEEAVQIEYKYIDSMLLTDEGEYKSLDWYNEEYDPWDLTDLHNYLFEEIHEYIFRNLGFNVIFFV
jgi:hypothetical protein